MKKFLMFSISFVVAVVIATGFYAEAYATTYTHTPTRSVVNSFPILNATHTFSGTAGAAVVSADTAYFPFSPAALYATGNGQDTVIAVMALQSKASTVNTNGDSTYVTWQYQWSLDNSTWSTAKTLAVDSGSVTTAPIPSTAYTYNRIVKVTANLTGTPFWSTPYARVVAIGGGLSGGYHNSPGNIISFTLLK